MNKFPSQEMDRFNVRLPAGMRDAIAERAKANGRSMNSEIVQILEDALDSGFTLRMNEEFAKIYNELITSEPNTNEEFDKNNERIDWLIDHLMWKIDSDSSKVRELLEYKKSTNKKP